MRAEQEGVRRTICDMVLLIFHLVLSSLTFEGVDIHMAQNILDYHMARYPNGSYSFLPCSLSSRVRDIGRLIPFATDVSHSRRLLSFYLVVHTLFVGDLSARPL